MTFEELQEKLVELGGTIKVRSSSEEGVRLFYTTWVGYLKTQYGVGNTLEEAIRNLLETLEE